MVTGSFPGVKYGRGVLLTTHPLLVPPSWKSRAIPLPTLWATTGPVTGTLYLLLFSVCNLGILHPCRWPHCGPKHVAVWCSCKLISSFRGDRIPTFREITPSLKRSKAITSWRGSRTFHLIPIQFRAFVCTIIAYTVYLFTKHIIKEDAITLSVVIRQLTRKPGNRELNPVRGEGFLVSPKNLDCGALPAFYLMGPGDISPSGKAAGKCSWPLASISSTAEIKSGVTPPFPHQPSLLPKGQLHL